MFFLVLSESDKSLRAKLISISAFILLLHFSSVTGEIVKLINVLVLPKTLTKESAFPQNDYLTNWPFGFEKFFEGKKIIGTFNHHIVNV